MIKTPEFELAESLINETSQNIFLTGKAGTGKTTFLKHLKETSHKRMIVVAPTGVAAINAGGMTIHSFFQINFGLFIPGNSKSAEISKIRKEKLNIIRTLDLIVMDEISMVRADLLDAIDDVLKKVRRSPLPFGGVQLLMIGDTQQLTPVVREDEKPLLYQWYDSPYFFSSKALQKATYSCIEFKTIFRQDDAHFIDLLNRVRENRVDSATITELNKRYIPNFSSKEGDGYIQLTTHNSSSQQINEQKLHQLKGNTYTFTAEVSGNFPASNYPADYELKLKRGAQVMFIKNDSSPEKRYYNGKIGWIDSIDQTEIIVVDEHKQKITVDKEVWENIKYVINPETKEIENVIDGTFTQIPLRTAWAITIHKSQGLTFDKAIIDAQNSFSHGQVYVALSRCRTFDGMVLSSPLSLSSIKHDHNVDVFNEEATRLTPTPDDLCLLKDEYYLRLIGELFSFKTIISNLLQLHRIISESLYKSYPKLIQLFEENIQHIEDEIIKISLAFTNQIAPFAGRLQEANNKSKIDERAKNGADYFLKQCNEWILPLIKDSKSIQTDNKEIAKKIQELSSTLQLDYAIKIATLTACTKGFTPQTYFAAKNNALLNQPKESNKTETTTVADIENKGLFELLRQWRKEKADSREVPVYMVLSQVALINICNALPSSKKELEQLTGVGKKTIDQYGDEILEIVRTGKELYSLSSPSNESSIRVKKTKKEKAPKENTFLITLKLAKQGMSISEIAKQRGLTQSTIESHILELIKTDQLPLETLTKQERINDIIQYKDAHPEATAKEIHDGLNQEYSWNEIRLAIWYASNLQ